jgi:glycosyltransferase involved in cell wall biosynthesis
VLNEERTLKTNVETVLAALKHLFEAPERVALVIADNGSTDRTQAIGEQLAQDNASVLNRTVALSRAIGPPRQGTAGSVDGRPGLSRSTGCRRRYSISAP